MAKRTFGRCWSKAWDMPNFPVLGTSVAESQKSGKSRTLSATTSETSVPCPSAKVCHQAELLFCPPPPPPPSKAGTQSLGILRPSDAAKAGLGVRVCRNRDTGAWMREAPDNPTPCKPVSLLLLVLQKIKRNTTCVI